MVDTFSVSGSEKELADAVEAALRPLAHLRVDRDGDTVVARTGLGRQRRVVIAGHLDTVPVNGNIPSELIRDELHGEELWGRGTADMKAGCAILLKLAAELADPAVDVTWVWYDNEEVAAEFNGLGRVSRNHPDWLTADFAILAEPTGAEIEGGCNGTLRAEIRTTGRRAHTARAWAGENAIHRAVPILELLAGYTAREVEVDGLVYREGLSAVGIRGGVAGNVVPDECVVTVNYRFAPDSSGAEAEARIRELFAGHEVTLTDLADGARPGLHDPLAQGFVAAIGSVPKPKYGWTDVARFAALGIPAINYGPGDPALAHADDERVPVAQIERCEAGLRAWLSA
ncbi:MAG TPA: succinyl-diaminopimelate desuccinylase [Pseudolysinimonas sp.]|nr:succinyl-diaminopimelate desuccinylase [Pseudolysinimonas sp.]